MSGLATDPRVSSTDPAGAADPAGGATRRRFSRSSRLILWLLGAAFFVLACLQLEIVPSRWVEVGERAGFVLGVIFPPTLENPTHVVDAAIESIQIAIVGTAFGIAMSLVLAVLAARNVSPLGPFCWIVKGIAAFERAVPSLVWALLFIVAVGLGPTPGILALAVGCIGMLVKVYAEAIEEIPMGPVEALRAAGASRLQVFLQGVLPGVAGVFIAWSVFRFDINIRYSSILGVVGAGGIGWELVRAAHGGHYDAAMGITLVIFVMVAGTELLSERLRKRAENESINARRKVIGS